jgi:type IV pilus assembly protein PilN
MIRINLLPVRAARKKEESQRQVLLFAFGLIAIVVFGLVFYQARKEVLTDLEDSNRLLQEEITNLKKIIGQVDEYKKQQALLEKKLEIIQTLKANKVGPVHMLDQIAQRIPEKLWLDSLEEAGGRLTLKGVSINNEVIATFMSKLEESDFFREVYLVSIQAKDVEELKLKEFTITAAFVVPIATEGT